MPVYTAKDRMKSGLPLGGIGAGKIELLPNGLFNAATFQNNWSAPLMGSNGYPGILGFHLGLFTEYGIDSKKKAFLLQTVPLHGIPHVGGIRYGGTFPKVELIYGEPDLPVEAALEAFSPWIPSDMKNSSLPCVLFTLKVKNKKPFPVRAGFLFIGRNLCGEWCVGRRNRVYDEPGALHLEFSNEDPSPQDPRQGTFRVTFKKEGWETSFLESWNAVTKNFSFKSEDIWLPAWDRFKEGGVLPNTKRGWVVLGENQELCGALAAVREIAPGDEKQLSFSFSWYFPRHPVGHRYQKWFKGAGDVARYALAHKEPLERKVNRFQKAVFSLPFPKWFCSALLTNLAPFFSSTWYGRDGSFAFYEAPVVCPLMGTLDVGFYGSIPLSYFFPELEISQIMQFARAQREDGYIPHDLGKNRIDLPSDGTTFYQWKDLNPKFILMAYRDFLWSGNRKFLQAIYPHAKKALGWSLSKDHDGNGLPDHEGADQTFDLWEFHGVNAYTSSLFLAALLACERMATRMKDAAFAKECRLHFKKGSTSFEKELWNGRYFGDFCALSQLNGQWYASLLGLGYIADRRKIQRALSVVLARNSRHSDFGMVNSVHADGRLDRSNDHSRNVWSGMNYAFISLCAVEGFPLNNLLKQAEKIWDNVTLLQKSPWNQPDTIDSKTGHFVFGDSYYRNMAIWAIPIAFAMRNKKTASILRSLRKGL